MKKTNRTYYKYKIENLVNITKIVTIHYFDLPPRFKSDGEVHDDFWELVYAHKSDIGCIVNGEETILKEGEAIFHKPKEHHIHMTGDEGASIFIISFVSRSQAMSYFDRRRVRLDREMLKYVFMLFEESRGTFDLGDTNHSTKKMPLKQKPRLGGMQAIRNALELLLIELMREGETDTSNPRFISDDTIDEYIAKMVIEYLGEHIRATVRIEDISRELNYTKSYLERRFKAATGKTIIEYFITLKMGEAKRLLRESEMSVTEISSHLAFDTPNYFSKCFKRHSGYTPLEYRRIKRMQK